MTSSKKWLGLSSFESLPVISGLLYMAKAGPLSVSLQMASSESPTSYLLHGQAKAKIPFKGEYLYELLSLSEKVDLPRGFAFSLYDEKEALKKAHTEWRISGSSVSFKKVDRHGHVDETLTPPNDGKEVFNPLLALALAGPKLLCSFEKPGQSGSVRVCAGRGFYDLTAVYARARAEKIPAFENQPRVQKVFECTYENVREKAPGRGSAEAWVDCATGFISALVVPIPIFGDIKVQLQKILIDSHSS